MYPFEWRHVLRTRWVARRPAKCEMVPCVEPPLLLDWKHSRWNWRFPLHVFSITNKTRVTALLLGMSMSSVSPSQWWFQTSTQALTRRGFAKSKGQGVHYTISVRSRLFVYFFGMIRLLLPLVPPRQLQAHGHPLACLGYLLPRPFGFPNWQQFYRPRPSLIHSRVPAALPAVGHKRQTQTRE